MMMMMIISSGTGSPGLRLCQWQPVDFRPGCQCCQCVRASSLAATLHLPVRNRTGPGLRAGPGPGPLSGTGSLPVSGRPAGGRAHWRLCGVTADN